MGGWGSLVLIWGLASSYGVRVLIWGLGVLLWGQGLHLGSGSSFGVSLPPMGSQFLIWGPSSSYGVSVPHLGSGVLLWGQGPHLGSWGPVMGLWASLRISGPSLGSGPHIGGGLYRVSIFPTP